MSETYQQVASFHPWASLRMQKTVTARLPRCPLWACPSPELIDLGVLAAADWAKVDLRAGFGSVALLLVFRQQVVRNRFQAQASVSL